MENVKLFFQEVLWKILEICAVLSGCLVVLVLSSEVSAEGLFVEGELHMGHQKNRSMICHSGGMSRNLVMGTTASIGYQFGDFYVKGYYDNTKCMSNGRRRDERSRFVRGRIEEIGISTGFRVDL